MAGISLQVPAMSWGNARSLGEQWASEHLPENLSGKKVRFASFADEETCRFFYPSWTMEFQRMVVSAAARMTRKRRGKAVYETVTLSAYHEWLNSRTDSMALRKQFLDEVQQVQD